MGSILDALAEDLGSTATGSSQVSGTFRGKQAYIEGIWRRLDERLERWLRAQVLRILADGEWATIDFHGIGGLGRNGTDYTLDYCWVMRVADGLVREVIGNYDQMKIAELFEPA